jgi:predicted membrane protein
MKKKLSEIRLSTSHTVIIHNGIYPKFLMRFFHKYNNFPSPSSILPPSQAFKLKEKCFMINTAEISMFNLNRSAASAEEKRAPDELAIMKIVYIIFSVCVNNMKKVFRKNFPPIIAVISFFFPHSIHPRRL